MTIENPLSSHLVMEIFQEGDLKPGISTTTEKCANLVTPEAISFGSIPSPAKASLHLLDWVFSSNTDNLKDIDFQELKFLDPELILGSLDRDEFQSTLTLSSFTQKEKEQITNDLPTMNVEQFYLSFASTYSGSCGATASCLEALLCGDKEFDFVPLEDSRELAQLLRGKVEEKREGQWFCRVNAGGHAFVVEYGHEKFRIYQSFFGKYNLSSSLKNVKTYDVEEFLHKIEIALSSDHHPDDDSLSRQQYQNKIDLFSSPEVSSDDIKVKVLEHDSFETIDQRMKGLLEDGERAWQPYLDKPIMPYLNKSIVSDSLMPPAKIELTETDVHSYVKDQRIFNSDMMAIEQDELPLTPGETYYFDRFGIQPFVLLEESNMKFLFTLEEIAVEG